MTTPRVEYLTIAEVGRELRVSRTLLYRLMAAGEIRRVRVGGRRLVSRRELERFVSRNTVRG